MYTFRGVDMLARTMTFPNKPVPRTSWISYYFFLFTEGGCDITFWETSENILLTSHKKGESTVIRVQKRKLAKKREKTYHQCTTYCSRRVSRRAMQRDAARLIAEKN
jgi:hypothetical protein